jgi:hypothetical protein
LINARIAAGKKANSYVQKIEAAFDAKQAENEPVSFAELYNYKKIMSTIYCSKKLLPQHQL